VIEKSKKEDPSANAKAESKPDRPSNLCCYSQRICNVEKLKGFDFCHKHILEDKASPFKPCDFVAKSNGRRCPNPAPKLPARGKSFCIIHTRKAELRRAVEERRKRRHHEGDGEESYDGDREKRRRTSSSNSQKSDKLDNHSSDDEGGASGDDYLKVDSAWHGDIDSDAESVDSEEEDPLKHAGVWTVEEATRMCRDKMIRLRSLYIAQFKRLQHVLKERKRKYYQAIHAEEEEETGECNLTPTQLLGHKPLHERPGTETLLRKQAKEKKQGTNARQQAVSTLRCTYSPGGNRCTEKVLPLTKHCIKHICHDPNQLLFQQCTFQSKGESQCDRNVAKIFKHTSCRLHVELPSSMNRPDVKKDLQDAEERAKLRKARALELKDQPDVPEALQQKSIALLPPPTTDQTEETTTISSEPQQDSTSIVTDSLSAGSEKLGVDVSDDTRKSATEGAVTAASSTRSNAESASDPSESISPGFAAASLVAVCSSPQLPSQGTPLSSVSDINQSSESDNKTVPINSGDKQQSKSDASSDALKRDTERKLPEAAAEENLKGASMSTAVGQEEVSSKPQELAKTDSAADTQSVIPDSGAEQPKQTTAETSVTKDTTEENITPFSTSTSQNSASQGTLSATKVTSPTLSTASLHESSIDPAKVPSKTASSSSKVTSSAMTKVGLGESSEGSPVDTSKDTMQSSTKSFIQEVAKNTPPSALTAPPSAPKQVIQVPPLVYLSQPSTASSSAPQPSKASTTKGHMTSDTPRPTPVKPFQHLPSGMTSSSSKQFSAITSVISKDTNRETKTDNIKTKDPADTGKL
ncbi:unnamed protein product, partial [Porites evermanni]